MVPRRQLLWLAGAAVGLAIAAASAWAHGDGSEGQKWVASWAASAHGPYPSGNAVAQPDLSFAFGSPAVVNSTLGTIDHLHPNRAGYLSMAKTIDLRVLAPPRRDGHHDRDD
jgi:lysophospholipase L1-like esterase